MKPQRSTGNHQRGIKYTVTNLIFKVASGLNAILPSLNIISLCSTPDYTDSAKSLFDYLNQKNRRERIPVMVWHVKDARTVQSIYEKQVTYNKKALIVKKNRILSFLLFCLSKYIVDTHGLYSAVKLKNTQKSLYLTHGMPVKKFGFEYDNDIQIGVQHADYALATSPFYRDVISRSMGIEIQNVYPFGLPRNDIFFREDGKEEIIRSRLSQRYIVYLPTYRVSNDHNKNNGIDLSLGDRVFGGTKVEWAKLNEKLAELQTKIVIKPHPLELHNDLSNLSGLSQVIIINDDWIIKNDFSLNLILKYSSALITDYSGAYVDYLLTDNPIIFFIPDYDDYKESRGYVLDDFLERLPGMKTTSFTDIGELLEKDECAKKREEARQLLNTQMTGDASEKVYDLLFKQ